MGQKVHPHGFRLGYTKTWRSRWFAAASYRDALHEDLRLRRLLKKRLYHAGISRVEIERPGNKLNIYIYTSRPGIIIGRKGTEVEKLTRDLRKRTGKEVHIRPLEVIKPELDPQLVAESIALQLEKRIAFRRAMRKAVENTMRNGAKGVRIRCAGRLNGADIARSEWYLEGQLPLHTLRADIEYGLAEAFTTYGQIGVKCWIYRGEGDPGGRGSRGEAPARVDAARSTAPTGPAATAGSAAAAGPAAVAGREAPADRRVTGE